MKVALKTLLLAFGLFTFSFSAHAQTSLEFNQVLYETFSGSTSGSGSSVMQSRSLSVPTGKVWKVTAVRAKWDISAATLFGNCSSDPIGMYMDDVTLFYSALTTSNYPNFEGVIWLPAGTYTFELRGYSCSSGSYAGNGFLSVIEFNVVP